ncbi:MAG: VCBS repeat-containing protein [Pseudorhodobacter sp.]|nr:VCBS repeat-containing protein [Pseudorhodobacter sp.]
MPGAAAANCCRGLALCCGLALPLAAGLAAEAQTRGEVMSARLIQPTDRYDHGVLGDALEWGGLALTVRPCPDCAKTTLTITLPDTRVFEDVEARLADLDGDGRAEVLVVETDLTLGASLAIYDATGKVAATPHIGQTHRWLAPAGWGDFDDDGEVEIAYVDRPHLLRELVFLRYRDGRLSEIARIPGLTNHRIGDSTISGGTRNCGMGDELILADARWQRVMALRLNASPRVLGPLRRPRDIERALACRN